MGRRQPKSIVAPPSVVSPNFDYTEIVKATIAAQAATAHIPALVKAELDKGWRQLPNAEPASSPKSWFFDPLSLQYSLGYKDRRYSVTYDTLKRITGQLSIISAIINVRSSQVAAFCQPYRWTKSLGFVLRHKDPDHPTTPAEIAFIKELEQFVMNCGRAEENPYSTIQRDDFETFLRKIVRDTLIYDQVAAEIVRDRLGIPFEFYAVDAATIRFASDDRYSGVNASYHQREGFVPSVPARFAGLYEGRKYGHATASGQRVHYVQVINGQIENVFGYKDLAFGVRNPRTDIYCFPAKTPVLLANHTDVPIESIAVGDSVVSHVGVSRNVLKTFKRHYAGPLVSIRARSAAATISSTPEHPFFVSKNANLRHVADKERTLRWVPSKDVQEGDYLAVPKLHVVEQEVTFDLLGSNHEVQGLDFNDEFIWTNKSYSKQGLIDRDLAITAVAKSAQLSDSQLRRLLYAPEDYCLDTHNRVRESLEDLGIDFADFITKVPRKIVLDERFAFVCGLWVAEGSVSGGRYVNFTFHRNETDLSTAVTSFFSDIGVPWRITQHPTAEAQNVCISSVLFANFFLRTFGEGAGNKTFPEPVFVAPRAVRIALIEGYLRGDGSYQVHKGIPTIQVACISRNLVHRLATMLNVLGFYVEPRKLRDARIGDFHGASIDQSTVYGFTLTGAPTRTFDQSLKMFENIPTTRRGLHYLESENYFLVRVAEVGTEQFTGDVFNFEVEEDNSYVVGPYAVHNCQGYGYGELEQLITIVTSHLNAERYNALFFTQGSAPKGILNFKGDNWTPEQLEMFRRHWTAQVSGTENSWKTPILQSEGMEWIDLNKSNSEMEFGKWMEYLLKVTCGVFLIDPAELNFDMHGGVQQTPLFESSQEWKLKASRDRGLKPLLKFIAKLINKYIIDPIDDHFTFEFVGLDEMSEQEKHEMLIEQISSYMTLNEARRTLDLPDLQYGDIPMNPTYIQAMTAQQQNEQQQQAQQEGQPGEGEDVPPADAEEEAPPPAAAAPPEEPQYSGLFGYEQGGNS